MDCCILFSSFSACHILYAHMYTCCFIAFVCLRCQAVLKLVKLLQSLLIVQYCHAWFQRIAETLDAEIKRWASGKEGNLRALLSTMQYVCFCDLYSIYLTSINAQQYLGLRSLCTLYVCVFVRMLFTWICNMYDSYIIYICVCVYLFVC